MIALFDKKEDCCGCSACAAICPTKSISMIPDDEGFLYPEINHRTCVGCKKCVTVCPLKQDIKSSAKNDSFLKVYACKHSSDDVRKASTSGGVYTALSNLFIYKWAGSNSPAPDAKGVCFGVAYNDSMDICHVAAYTETERDKFRGSKYVQSAINDVFLSILTRLDEGYRVLFTGTPCQCAALDSLHKGGKTDFGGLYINDIVCMGVPSPKLWRDFVKMLEERHKNRLVNFIFRGKENGWRNAVSVSAEFENGLKISNSRDVLVFSKIFYSGLALRPSCYNCSFASLRRPSDITIGDFWGIQNCIPDFEDDKGVSLVLVNSAKGAELFERMRSDIEYVESNTADCMQRNLKMPTPCPERRNNFWTDYKKRGFGFISKKYGGCGVSATIRSSIAKLLRAAGLLPLVRKCLYSRK